MTQLRRWRNRNETTGQTVKQPKRRKNILRDRKKSAREMKRRKNYRGMDITG